MRRSLLKALAALSVAAAAVGVSTPAVAANGDYLGGCDVTLTNPDALACQGYYSGNVLNGSDIALQQGAIAALPGTFTWDGNWTGLVNAGNVIGSGIYKPDYTPPAININAAYPSRRHLSAKVRAFVDYLADRFTRNPEWRLDAAQPPHRAFGKRTRAGAD